PRVLGRSRHLEAIYLRAGGARQKRRNRPQRCLCHGPRPHQQLADPRPPRSSHRPARPALAVLRAERAPPRLGAALGKPHCSKRTTVSASIAEKAPALRGDGFATRFPGAPSAGIASPTREAARSFSETLTL